MRFQYLFRVPVVLDKGREMKNILDLRTVFCMFFISKTHIDVFELNLWIGNNYEN